MTDSSRTERAGSGAAAQSPADGSAAGPASGNPRLALFWRRGCVYCERVLAAIEDLDLDVELRDVGQEAGLRDRIEEESGGNTVPALRVERGDEILWMGESRDIVEWLYDRFGEGRSPPPAATGTHDRILLGLMWVLLVTGALVRGEVGAAALAAGCLAGAVRHARIAFNTRSSLHGVVAAVFVAVGAGAVIEIFGLLGG